MIGILTFHHVYNHGALLQAFALQEYLKELNQDVVVIDSRPFERKAPTLHQGWSPIKLLDPRYIRYRAAVTEKKKRFDLFRSERLMIDGNNNTIESIISRLGITHVVVGSDQVWNPKYGTEAMSLYTLSNIHSIRKTSYAACIGSERVKLHNLEQHASALNNFHQLSTRDSFSKDAVVALTGKQCEIVVDPTLLIDWEKTALLEKQRPQKEPYVFVYGFSKQTDSVLSVIKNKLRMPVVGIGMENEYKSRFVDIYAQQSGPEEFVQLIKASDLVITKSYHGLMLAVSLKKQVIVVSHGLPSISRIRDFTSICGLNNIIVNEDNLLSLADFDRKRWIDYESLAPKLAAWINRSKSYLRATL